MQETTQPAETQHTRGPMAQILESRPSLAQEIGQFVTADEAKGFRPQ